MKDNERDNRLHTGQDPTPTICQCCGRPIDRGIGFCDHCSPTIPPTDIFKAPDSQRPPSLELTSKVNPSSESDSIVGLEFLEEIAQIPACLVGRYRVDRVLGHGGMGTVFLAHDQRLDRSVALKVMRKQSPDMVEGLEREGRLLAALEHDHIVRVYDFGVADGLPYLVMEYVRGVLLSDRLAEGRPTLIEAVRIVQDILKAVAEAHRHGIIHRDLKPSNVFLDETGRVKVADFGLGRRFRKDSGADQNGISPGPGSTPEALTSGQERGQAPGPGGDVQGHRFQKAPVIGQPESSSTQGGTPAYMAPEQWRRQAQGPACDIFSVALILYEMLTGRKYASIVNPFSFLSSRPDPIPLPSQFNPGVSAGLDQIVSRALTVDPELRPTAATFVELLSGWMDGARRSVEKRDKGSLPSHPYKFLAHYEISDQQIFFGRDAEIAEIVQIIHSDEVRVLFLFGPCGIGKSSLLRAGIVSVLDPQVYDPLVVLSGADPALSVGEAILSRAAMGRDRSDHPTESASAPVVIPLNQISETVIRLGQASNRTLVVVIDQLEELFTQRDRDSGTVGRFFAMVEALARLPNASVRFVLAFRAEFRGALYPLEESLGRRQRSMALREIGENGLGDAIEGPSRFSVYGFQFQEGFARALAHEIHGSTRGAGDAALPVLQIVCRQLFDRMRAAAARTIGWDLYGRELGGVKGALRRYVEERLDDPAYVHGGTLARQMLKMLTVKEGGDRFAHARNEEDLLAFPDREGARKTLERLIDDHLIVRIQERDGTLMVRLASEVICPLIDGWTLEVGDVDRAARTLARAHASWQESGKRTEDLLSGSALALVQRHRVALHGLTESEQEFLCASGRKQLRWRAGLAFAASMACGLAVAMAYLAYLRPGTLKLDSEPPGAMVQLGGKRLGETPLAWTARPGVYSLRLTKAGYDPTRVDVRIPAGWFVDYRPVLRYPFGILSMGSDPSGADCEVLAERPSPAEKPVRISKTPFTTELPAGRYRLVIKKTGYRTASIEGLVLRANRDLVHKVVPLERDVGFLVVRCPPHGKTVTVRSTGPVAFQARAPLPLERPLEVPSGTVQVECVSNWATRAQASVTVSRNTTTAISLWLEQPRTLWTTELGGIVTTGAAIADLDQDGVVDVVTATENNNVHALSGRTGERLWRRTLGGQITLSSPALTDVNGDGVADVFIGAVDRKVYALSGKNGEVLWTVMTPGIILASPVVADLDGDRVGDVIIGSRDGTLFALSGKTGKPVWTYSAGGDVYGAAAMGDLDQDGVPDAVVGTRSGTIHAVSGRNGTRIWLLKNKDAVTCSAALGDLNGDGRLEVVIGSRDGFTYVLSGHDGTVLFRLPSGPVHLCSPALADLNGDGVPDIVTGSQDNRVIVFCGKTREIIWSFRTGGMLVGSAMTADLTEDGVPDVIIGSSDHRTLLLDGKDGHCVLALSTPEIKSVVPPVALADLDNDGVPELVAGISGEKVVAVSVGLQRPRWIRHVEGGVSTPPVVVDLDGDQYPDFVAGLSSMQFCAVSGRTGQLFWRTAMKRETNIQPIVRTTIADLDQNGLPDVICSVTYGRIEARAGKTGNLLWSTTIPPPLLDVRPVTDYDGDGVSDVLAFVLTGSIHVLSGRTGKPLWQIQAGDEIPDSPVVADLDRDGMDDIIVPLRRGKVTAISGRSRTPLWSVSTSGDLASSPALADVDRDGVQDVLVGSMDGTAQALSGKTGRAIWTTKLGGQPSNPPAAADLDADGVPDAVFPMRGGRLIAVSGRAGSRLWEYIADSNCTTPGLLYLDGDEIPDLVTCTMDSVYHFVSGKTGRRLRVAYLPINKFDIPLVLDPDEPWAARQLTNWDVRCGTPMTRPRPGPRQLLLVTSLLGNFLATCSLPWPSKPRPTYEPVFFTRTRSCNITGH